MQKLLKDLLENPINQMLFCIIRHKLRIAKIQYLLYWLSNTK